MRRTEAHPNLKPDAGAGAAGGGGGASLSLEVSGVSV